MKNIDSICYSSIYKIEHPNEFQKTLTFQSRKKTIPLFSHMNDNMTVDDQDLVNSLLEFHINSFLAFFMQRRLDKEFKKYDCHLTMLDPADVLSNGLENKIYQIHEDDLAGLSLYHRAKKKPLHTLFPLTGTIESKFFSGRINNLFHPNPERDNPNNIFVHYKHMWEQFSNILLIIRETEIENDQDSLTTFHHRQISHSTQTFTCNNVREFVSNVV